MENKFYILENINYRDPVYGEIKELFYILKNIHFGLSLDRRWVLLKGANKDIQYLDNDSMVQDVNDSLLALLEVNIQNFIIELQESLRINSVSKLSADTFPYELIILNGLHTQSDWWVNLAIDWFLGMPKKNSCNYKAIKFMLEEIKNNKAYDQKVRQKTKKAIQLCKII